MSHIRSNARRMKELKVLELHDKGFSSREIASIVHMSLRDVTKFINLASNKIKSPSVTSIHDEIVLEYRVNLLRSEVRDLESERDNLRNEVNDLRAQRYDLQNQVRAKQTELDVVKRDLENEKFSKILDDILT
jgi:chromosome segregation ATPase